VGGLATTLLSKKDEGTYSLQVGEIEVKIKES